MKKKLKAKKVIKSNQKCAKVAFSDLILKKGAKVRKSDQKYYAYLYFSDIPLVFKGGAIFLILVPLLYCTTSNSSIVINFLFHLYSI